MVCVCVSVCECFNWVFNQGVMLSVPIRYSMQGSPAGCLWTTTPSKREIMIPHSDSKKINNATPLSLSLSLSLRLYLPPPRLCSKSDRWCEKMKQNYERKVRAGMRVCPVIWQRENKRIQYEQQTNMIQCCVLWPSTCHKPFPKTVWHTHLHCRPCYTLQGRHNHSNCVFFFLPVYTITICDAHTLFHMSKDIIPVAAH